MTKSLILTIIGLCTLFYTAQTLWSYWQFSDWDQNIPLEKTEWEIVSKDIDSHTYQAVYLYTIDGNDYRGEYHFKKPVFVNLLGAEHALENFSKDYKTAWISSKNPKNSTLEKIYPLKELISTGLLWVIYFYFLLAPVIFQRLFG